jgi:predicted nucleic acid-binding protein
MIFVYVETNFILEMAFSQEQVDSCESILSLCESAKAKLIIPSFSIGECFEALVRKAKARKELASKISQELRQISRSGSYREEVSATQGITALLVRSSEEDENRLDVALRRILSVAEIIPLDASVIAAAESSRRTYTLGHQDSVVYASVVAHLRAYPSENSCFLNRNSRDFDDPDIEATLNASNCRMLFRFDRGFEYISNITNQ